jgi:hypothetical protein
MIKISNIKPGDRVGVRHNGHSVTRTVKSVGKDYVVIEIGGAPQVVFGQRITSHIGVTP